MDDSLPLPPWLRQALIGCGLFVLGGLIAFGYSYRPLHGAKVWKIEQLEARLDERNLENLKLSDDLARLQAEDVGRVDADAHEAIEKKLSEANTALAQARKDLDRAKRKRQDANKSARKWRNRYEKLRDETSVAAAKPTPSPSLPAASPADASAPRAAAGTPEAPQGSAESAPAAPSTAPASPNPAETGILPSTPPASSG